MDSRVLELLTQHMDHLVVNAAGRVECTLNGHAMPARADVLAAFVAGPKFRKLQQRDRDSKALEKYEPFLVQSRNFRDKLFCALTCQLLTKSVDGVRKHMNGRRFQEAKEKYERDELELMSEPPGDSESEQSRPEASSAVALAAGGGDEGMWVPEEYLGHEAAARELESEAAGGEAGGSAAKEHSARPSPASVQPATTAKRKRAAGEPAAAVDGRATDRRKGSAGDARGSGRKPLELLNRKKRKVQPASKEPQQHADAPSDSATQSAGKPAAKSRQPRKQKPPVKAELSSKPPAAQSAANSPKQAQAHANGMTRPDKLGSAQQQGKQNEMEQRKKKKHKPPKPKPLGSGLEVEA